MKSVSVGKSREARSSTFMLSIFSSVCAPAREKSPILRRLSEDVAIDELFSVTPKKETELLPPEKRKNPDDMILYIRVDSKESDRIRINLPIPLVKLAISMGIKLPQVSRNDILKNIDFEQILELVEKGLIGKLVEVESADGDTVEIAVE